MSETAAPAGWFPDPERPGGQRYWDGAVWTEHRVPPPGAPWPGGGPPPTAGYVWGPPPWKGAQLGRPASGPGSLADPGRRLAARLLDGLVLLPAFAVLLGVTLAVAAPHFGPIFPTVPADGSGGGTTSPPGFLWIEVTVIGCALVTNLLSLVYETVVTARWGRTLGKAWMHVRPLQVDGSTLGFGRCLGRAAATWVLSVLGWVGLLDDLWCLWDDRRQCLHDKMASTIVVSDR